MIFNGGPLGGAGTMLSPWSVRAGVEVTSDLYGGGERGGEAGWGSVVVGSYDVSLGCRRSKANSGGGGLRCCSTTGGVSASVGVAGVV